jgi:circadian clock protein KaiB
MMIKKKTEYASEGKLVLQLYVSGMSPKSMEAIENIKRLCDDNLKDAFELEIVDLYKNPEAASLQQIVFSPSLVKQFPLPSQNHHWNFCRHAESDKRIRYND